MNRYSRRGWVNLAFIAAVVLLWAALCRAMPEDFTWHTVLLPILPQFFLFIEQRMMSEEQWKKRQNENDERHRLVMLRSAALAFALVELVCMAAVFWALFRENEFAVTALCIVFITGGITFSVAQMIWEKKM